MYKYFLTDRTNGAPSAEQYTSTSPFQSYLPRHAATMDDPAINAVPSGNAPIFRTASRVIPQLICSSTWPRDDRRDVRRRLVANRFFFSLDEDDVAAASFLFDRRTLHCLFSASAEEDIATSWKKCTELRQRL